MSAFVAQPNSQNQTFALNRDWRCISYSSMVKTSGCTIKDTTILTFFEKIKSPDPEMDAKIEYWDTFIEDE